jgi:putative colanic acid biosynthesis acetyltransferase WcaF
MKIDLSQQSQSNYKIGRSKYINYLWYLVSSVIFISPYFPFYRLKVLILRLFGANIGFNVIIKPRVTIKFPWKLSIGNNSSLGECSWIDNLDMVSIGNNVCISQSAYICTGSHDSRSQSFDLITKPIVLKDGVWIGSSSIVLQGVVCYENSILSASSVAFTDLEESYIYRGNPAIKTKERIVKLRNY